GCLQVGASPAHSLIQGQLQLQPPPQCAQREGVSLFTVRGADPSPAPETPEGRSPSLPTLPSKKPREGRGSTSPVGYQSLTCLPLLWAPLHLNPPQGPHIALEMSVGSLLWRGALTFPPHPHWQPMCQLVAFSAGVGVWE
ncbi:hypothetical protein KUCAC02_029304, partial [Chaenocephalus aceratus]